ncbi:redox-sensing transcriptional repressor Rex [Enterococcus dongliensis]|uniref:Redox-sensing transcriptional repressor Rex n=1 Tax=Enterococcus dongliensis TaxID=2559925 RepID=A0AAP5KR14_9ENTE|nr:redox-sensing transcriptional repressor Rex [Enterococcus dongliensis]MDT2596607.1 redox-sensing transcriptional repressor Rex [Enterococcus dongliensis]MDT2603665.1 redox-sensing transcriptional repressor Rex [Enterococcus dongliensis]MDT2634407.1 redox-sensing transcriptional repressor Rex [Enterococcus dongliensis]MDT2637401.1 redox-sensing transcriptional repressor Rex [Enterococcus dongliensis]MDT2642515.1 redox-sensing transcriptional repressor Rex [Enterococcus dongliensis]
MERILQKPRVSKATTKRLSLYLRCLKGLEKNGITRIKSSELSKMTQVGSATIRRDFSHFGELGRSGYGYDVSDLIKVFSDVLETKEEKRIALIGCGNLGQALLNNNFRRNENLNIVCAFDNDPEKIGKEICGYHVYSIEDMTAILAKEKITVVISTVPSQNAQTAIDQVVANGITAILNFAPDPLKVPDNVHVHYIDLTSELQTLIYFDGQ